MNRGRSTANNGHTLLSRRQLLRIGGFGFSALNLAGLFRAEALQAASVAKVKACILLFHYGGPSHLDTWDPKPAAPREIRGEFRPIATAVPGIQVSEHLPLSARLMDRLAIVRSFHHPMTNHNAAAVEALCGRTPLKGDLELLADDANAFPCYGAALTHLLPRDPLIPMHVALPHVLYNVVVLPGQTAGFLGSTCAPYQVTQDPSLPDFNVGELMLPADLPLGRLDDRRALLRLVDQQTAKAEQAAGRRAMDTFQQRALALLHSDAVRRSFDLSHEDPRTRDRYGRHKLGQSALLARRLVEAGVRFINVNDKIYNGQTANWDSHENNFNRHKDDLIPPSDQAFSALIEDLAARGLLDSTLVIWIGEFGRTPRINANSGRDHWPNCFSVVLAGGGVKGGTVYGSSDRVGAYPDTNPVSPGDLAATIFACFGIDPETEIRDVTGRPYRLADGQPLHELFA
jgi:uncharacterized protein (DUF1501 family)